jgi:hypothetical protein
MRPGALAQAGRGAVADGPGKGAPDIIGGLADVGSRRDRVDGVGCRGRSPA